MTTAARIHPSAQVAGARIGAGVQVDQNIFDSGKTRSAVGQSESQVLGARATLRIATVRP